MGQTAHFLVQHGYVVLFVWLFAEQAAVPVPSIPLLLACGALARAGKLDLLQVLLCGTAACLIADNLWFQLGRRGGARIVRFVCRMALEPDSCVRRTENNFGKYGMRCLLVSKFVPGLNAVAAPLAGSSGGSRSRFLLFDTAGSIVWIASYAGLGYLLSDQLETVAAYAMRTGIGMALLLVMLLAGWIGWKLVQRRRFVKGLAIARITAEELRDRLQAGEDVLIVDLRSNLIAGADPIPGALRVSAGELAARHAEIPRDREVVMVCS